MCFYGQVCVLRACGRLTHCCYASYEWLKCVLGLNVSWEETSRERHLCLRAWLPASITFGWTCGAWLVAIKNHITIVSTYTAENGSKAPIHEDLIWGNSHLPYQSHLVDIKRSDRASCQGCMGLALCCCLWFLVFTLAFHCFLTHSSDTPVRYYREIKLCLTWIGLLRFMKGLSRRQDAKWAFCYALVGTWAHTHKYVQRFFLSSFVALCCVRMLGPLTEGAELVCVCITKWPSHIPHCLFVCVCEWVCMLNGDQAASLSVCR